jgi:hypothetical protein
MTGVPSASSGWWVGSWEKTRRTPEEAERVPPAVHKLLMPKNLSFPQVDSNQHSLEIVEVLILKNLFALE